MKTPEKTEAAEHVWGIYHLDREYARELGDPLRTVVRAASKEDAEREAERLGFGVPGLTQSRQWTSTTRIGCQSTCVIDRTPGAGGKESEYEGRG